MNGSPGLRPRRPAEWHLPEEAVQRYADPGRGRRLSPAEATSVEAHLDDCALCRGRLSPAVDAELLSRIGSVLVERVAYVPQYRRPRRRRIRLTAGLPVAWLLATVAIAALAGGLDAVSGAAGGGRPSLLLLLSPVLPLSAVAAAWAPGLDPLRELTASTPAAGLPLLLRRTLVALLAVVSVSAGIGALGVPAPPAQWLLPCLALTAVSLALGRVIPVHVAAAGLAAAWALAVVLPAVSRARVPVLLDTSAAPAWAVTLVLAVAVVTRQRRTYQRLDR